MPTEAGARIRPSQRPRYRYILFEVQGVAPDRNAIIERIQERAAPALGAWLTRYEAGRGILRVLRGHEKEGRKVLESLRRPSVKTLSTSGTIAALERGHRQGRRAQLGDG